MKQADLKIEYLDIGQLTPYEKNCKIHTVEQIRRIAASIRNFGFNDPLGIWGQDNIVLEGNGRLEALKMLGVETVPCIRLDHMNDNERRAYIIAHNHLNLQTGFNETELLSQLQELQNSVDLHSLGINADDYVSKLSELEKKRLQPYCQVHYLVSLDLNDNHKIVELLEQIKTTEGVEIESTLN